MFLAFFDFFGLLTLSYRPFLPIEREPTVVESIEGGGFLPSWCSRLGTDLMGASPFRVACPKPDGNLGRVEVFQQRSNMQTLLNIHKRACSLGEWCCFLMESESYSLPIQVSAENRDLVFLRF